MNNKHIKAILLLLLVTVILTSAVNATKVSNDTSNTDTTQKKVALNDKTIKKMDNTNIIPKKEEVSINKENKSNKKYKTESNTYTVNYFKPLKNILTSDKYDNLTININSDIKFIESVTLSESISHLTINGNNKKFNAYHKHSFLNISNKSCVNIKNLELYDYGFQPDSFYGAFSNYGELILENVTLKYSSLWMNAIINYGNLSIYDSILGNNLVDEGIGGAIYNHANLTVNNTTFIDNQVTWSGAAIENEGNAVINNSIFKNNMALVNFGGAIGNLNNMSIYNTIFDNNQVPYEYSMGGAIYNEKYLYLCNCSFKNNKAWYGGAICNTKYLEIINSTFEKNQAYESGGAVDSNKLILENNLFYQNSAKDGGAVCTANNITITNNTFKENSANESGGAIAVFGHNYTKNSIKSNIFIKNNALNGSAIYNNETKINIIQNRFIQNNLINSTITNNNILVNNTPLTLENNVNFTNTYYPGQIETLKNCYIADNIVNDNQTETRLTIPTYKQKQYKQKVPITGKLKDKNGKLIKNATIQIKVNNKTFNTRTNNEGIYKYLIKASIIGTNNITVTYKGNKDYQKTTNKTTFKVSASKTKLTIPTYKQKQYKQKVTITGKLKDNYNNIIKNAKIKIKVNNKIYNTKTDNKGIYKTIITANKVGTSTVTVTYPGNKYYQTVTKKTTFKTVARATKLTVNKISTTTKGKTVKITGKLTDNRGTILRNTKIKIKINTKTVAAKTNSKGVYTYNYKASNKGSIKVTVIYPGNKNYKTSNAKTIFKVK